jgi:hypothetical protein
VWYFDAFSAHSGAYYRAPGLYRMAKVGKRQQFDDDQYDWEPDAWLFFYFPYFFSIGDTAFKTKPEILFGHRL